MHVTVAFLCHCKVLGNVWSSLRLKAGDFLFSESLLGAACHQLPDYSVLVEELTLISEEVSLRLSIAIHTELSVLCLVWPVKLHVHIVLTCLKIVVLFPNVTVLAHFAVFVSQNLLLIFRVLNFANN